MAYGSSAAAQEQTSSNDSGQLSEIVVTAQKREESLQRAPVAVTAVAQDTLVRAGVNNIMELSRVAPDVRVTRTAAGANIAIRGIVSADTSPTSETPNAVHIDGAYLPKPTGLEGFFYDIARIEVLKGPQGTLYGRNASGGAINIVTNRPTFDFAAKGEVEVGNYDLIRTTGALNVPINDTLATRFAFQTLNRSGYYKSGLDAADQTGGRFEALWKPNERQTLFFSADLEKIGGKGSGSSNLIGVIAAPRGPGDPNTIIPDPRDDTRFYGNAERNRYDTQSAGMSLQYDQDLGFATLTVQGAYRDINSDNWIAAGSPLGGINHAVAKTDAFTGEVRLTSNETLPLQYVVGAFAFTGRNAGYMQTFSTTTAVVPQLGFLNPYERANSYAAFGQATYTPPSIGQLHLTAGVRYTYDDKKADTATQFALNPYTLMHNTASWDAVTYKAGVSFDVTPQSLLYADISTGYKAGGFAYGATPLYDPERITAYQIGSKNRFFGNRLQLNLEGWIYDYKNYETNIAYFNANGINLTVTNAGAAKYYGASLESEFLVTPRDRLAMNVTYLHARYGQYDLNVKYPGLGLSNYTGTTIPGVPMWQGTASYTHTWDLGGGDLDAQIAMQYRGHTLLSTTATNTPNAVYITDDAWATFDVSVRYTPIRSKWNVTGYVRNIENEDNLLGAGYSNNTFGYVTGSFNAPRTFGVIVGASF